ncbi:unnamed protein product [Caenorhabditis angaria]|uniref:Uncharacterized protein n=1 Tax=Caenorhabditis angaria TaxID=860376 RepID=A0A9P1I4N5_9PELO|nr:unnamed protein product [Caenorhabditis angaria]
MNLLIIFLSIISQFSIVSIELVKNQKYPVNLSLYCDIKKHWDIHLFFTNDRDHRQYRHESHYIADSNWFNKTYLLSVDEMLAETRKIDIAHNCNMEGFGPWRRGQRNLHDKQTRITNFGYLSTPGSTNFTYSKVGIEFNLTCYAKLDWYVEVYYSNSKDVSSIADEQIQVKNSSHFYFRRNFKKNPTHIGFIHNCSSNPKIPYRKVPKTEYTEKMNLTNKGLIMTTGFKIIPLNQVIFHLYCGLKTKWYADIEYWNEYNHIYLYKERVQAENSNGIDFVRNFYGKPAKIAFQHDCTSDPQDRRMIVHKTKFKPYFDLTENGSIDTIDYSYSSK